MPVTFLYFILSFKYETMTCPVQHLNHYHLSYNHCYNLHFGFLIDEPIIFFDSCVVHNVLHWPNDRYRIFKSLRLSAILPDSPRHLPGSFKSKTKSFKIFLLLILLLVGVVVVYPCGKKLQCKWKWYFLKHLLLSDNFHYLYFFYNYWCTFMVTILLSLHNY